ncbi:MAG: Cell division protein FtsI [Peptidoglycan synthetase], partial [uncultured Frankineae bacterium]
EPPAAARGRRLHGPVRAAHAERQLGAGRQGRRLPRRPPQQPCPAAHLRARARRDRRRAARRQRAHGSRRVDAHGRAAHVAAAVPGRADVRPRDGLLLPRLRPHGARAQPGRGALRRGRPVLRAPALRHDHRPGARGRQHHHDARRRGAGGGVRRARRQPRCRRRPRPADRRRAGHGQQAVLRPGPAVLLRPGRHPRLLRRSQRGHGGPAAQQDDQPHLPARLDVQGRHRRRRAVVRRRHARDADPVAPRARPAADDGPAAQLRRQQLRRGVHHARRGAPHLVQHLVRLARPQPRGGAPARAGRGVRVRGRLPVGADVGRDQRLPRGPERAADGAVRHRAVRRPCHTAPDGHGGSRCRQRRRGHGALPRAGGAGPRPVAPRPGRSARARAGGRRGRRRAAHRDDGARGERRQRCACADRRRPGRRQDRHRPARAGPAAARVVHRLRPCRRPAGRRRRRRRGRWQRRLRGHGRRGLRAGRTTCHERGAPAM